MNDPLNVALISTPKSWGGGEMQAWYLFNGLLQRGHQCRLFAPGSSPLYQRAAAAGVPVNRLSSRLPLPWTVASLRRTLRTGAYHVVHMNDAHAVSLAGPAARRLPNIVCLAARRTSFPLRSAARYGRYTDALICVSQQAAQLAAAAGYPADRMPVVADGVDPRRVATGDRVRGRRGLGIADDELLVLSIGSLVPCKGHRHLIEAFVTVRQHCSRVRLAIAGAGPMEPKLRQLVSQLGLDSAVSLLGFRSDVPDLLQACDLFAFPSIAEGLGSSLIDAMFARRAIVTTEIDGIRDLVVPTDPGAQPLAWLVPPGDPKTLAQQLIVALADERGRRQRAELGHRIACGKFTVDHMVDATLSAYRATIGRRLHPSRTKC